MCWSATASVAMVGLGGAATVITARRGEPAAIWLTLGYFTVMEMLQAGGYAVIGECGSPANRSITLASYLHIAFQPLFINAFAMAVNPVPVSDRMRRATYALAGLATLLLLLRLVPFDWAGLCQPGQPLCGPVLCLLPGNWHIAWELPLNDMWGQLNPALRNLMPFPAYTLAVFVLPVVYGAWRLVAVHAVLGPILASALTDNPNEMPAIWCLFSVGLVLVGLSPLVRHRVLGSPLATAR